MFSDPYQYFQSQLVSPALVNPDSQLIEGLNIFCIFAWKSEETSKTI